MQHLSSKILAAIVACSATILLSGINVHASAERNPQPMTANRAKVVKPISTQVNDQLSKLVGHHYTYQNSVTVRDNQMTIARLGAYRARHIRRPVKNVKRVNKHSNHHVNHNRRKHRTNLKRLKRHESKRIARHHSRKTRSNRKVRRRSLKHSGRRMKRGRAKNRRNQKRNRTKRGRKVINPKLVHPRERVINQRKSAVNHFKKNVKYVKFDKPVNFSSPSDNSGDYGDSDYGRKGTKITGNAQNGSVTFNRLTFIPKQMSNNQFYSPQGLVVVGRYAYVITNATNSYEPSHSNDSDQNRQAPASYINGDDSTGKSPYGVGASQIIRIDLRHNVKDYNDDLKAAHHNIKIGPVFYGGHGQGLAYNPKTHQLWLLDNKSGQVTKSAASLINLRTLLPQLRINFHFGDTTIGDDLAFDRHGKALNVTEAGSDSFVPQNAVKMFTGNFNAKGVHMNLIKQVLQWGPSDVIQGLTYNPRNNRIYILGDDNIMSLPVNKLGRLTSADVWDTPFSSTREFEGLSFDQGGNGYLLVNRSPEILKANYNKDTQF